MEVDNRKVIRGQRCKLAQTLPFLCSQQINGDETRVQRKTARRVNAKRSKRRDNKDEEMRRKT